MLVRDLASLVEIWRLVEKDPGTKEILLDRKGARVEGMHIDAQRRMTLPLEKQVSIDGALLVGTLALMPQDAELSVKQTGTSLILATKGRRAVLRVQKKVDPRNLKLFFKGESFDTSTLREELAFLRACTSGGVLSPILTGIHFAPPTDRGIPLEATDVERRTGRVHLSLPITSTGKVVPAADFDAALSLMRDTISMKFTDKYLKLCDGETAIQSLTIFGVYPNLSRLPSPGKLKYSIILRKPLLETAIRAAVLLDSDRIVTLSIKDGFGSLLVTSNETGGFRQKLGKYDVPDIDIVFDAHWLDAAQYVGEKIRLRYNDARSPVLFSGNRRLLWMSPLVKA